MPSEMMQKIQQIPLFADLRRDDLRDLSRLAKEVTFSQGEVICRQGQPGHSIYLVTSGQLRVLYVDPMGIQREVKRMGVGDSFGETSLLLMEPRDATVQALTDVTLVTISRDSLDQLLKQNPDLLKSLNMRPDVATKYRSRHFRFKWQDEDEIIIVSKHRHDAVMFRNIILPVFVFLITALTCWYWYRHTGTMIPLLIGGVLGLILLLLIAYLVADHRDERYIVTNKRVVRRDRRPLGREIRVDAPLRTIQDVQESQVGLLTQLFDFGDLIIETAGERGHVAFREIPDPEGVREIIFEQIRRLQSSAKVQEREAIQQDMQRYFEPQWLPPEEALSTPEPETTKEKSSRRGFLSWMGIPFRLFSYFLPPLQYEQGETITWRKHWIALLKPIALPTLLIVAFTVGIFFVLLRTNVDWSLALVAYGVALMILLPWWLWRFDDWQNDIYQVTASRIIDVERLPLFLREHRREASLGMIQNIKFEVPGTLGRLLNYGSVTIETAGAGAFTFDLVKNPSGVQSEIFRRMEAFQKQKERAAAEQHRHELLDWFAVYDQMRRGGISANPSEAPLVSQEE